MDVMHTGIGIVHEVEEGGEAEGEAAAGNETPFLVAEEVAMTVILITGEIFVMKPSNNNPHLKVAEIWVVSVLRL